MNRTLLERFAVMGLLAAIVLFSFYIRSVSNVPDKMVDYDPIFQYRFTKYFVDFGELPLWDELSYYVGRAVSTSAPGMIFYLTALVYVFAKGLGWSLMTTATFASAWYGALIAVPAFLLARDLSNKWGGLLGALLTATAPQILVRTFGSSFDTDQLAIFFILLTLWAGVYALRKRSIFGIAIASACFILFASAWQMYWYTFFFMAAAAVVYLLMNFASVWRGGPEEKKREIFKEARTLFIVIAAVFVIVIMAASVLQLDPLTYLFGVVGFAQEAEKQIVNISIAELQLIDITNIETWKLAIGRFSIGDVAIDNLFFISLVALMFYGLARSYKTDKIGFSFILTTMLMTVYTLTRGIRFTEFSSGLLIALAAAGFGHLMTAVKNKETFIKSFSVGVGIFLAGFALFNGLFLGQYLTPGSDQNWEDAWTYLRTQTPELSLVGTWWDPGHMITGKAERRVIADGAHCGYQCLYGINDRITSLGKIMATDDEDVSLELINKYRGTSPKVYWIASDDLISKYQWLQYFGLGCDANSDSNCQLYSAMGVQSARYDQNGREVVRLYGPSTDVTPIIMFSVQKEPVMIYVQGKNAALLGEVIYYEGDSVEIYKPDEGNSTALAQSLEPLVKQLGYRMSNQTVPVTAWVSKDGGMTVIIPPNLRNTVFTRMFFLEGQGLEHFKQVFRNERVKIYEVEL